MKLTKSLILAGTALTGLFVAGMASAQSTATQELETTTVVVKGAGKKSAAGLGVEQTVTKTRSSITSDYLDTQAPGSPLDAINLLPGVNFTDQDATGSVGFDITLRGFDSQRIALILDGMPLNDTGNYAIYPTMNIDSELYSRIDVNLGSTDVDSPTAAAGGGTVNFVTKKPSEKMGFQVKETLGDNSYHREFLRFDSGKFGPWGTTAYLTYSNLISDKWKGYGSVKRQQYNGGLYQPFGDKGDFVSLNFTYNRSRNNSYYDVSASEYTSDYDMDFAGTINSSTSTATGSSSGAYYGWKINPTDNGSLRLQSKFHLRDNLVLTIDPSFQYTKADGGTQVYLLDESTGKIGSQIYSQLINYDANGDGTIGSEYVFYPSLTRTKRYTLNSSLIWYLNDTNTLRVAYTYDHGDHRQTGATTFLTSDLSIPDPLSKDDSYAVIGSDGQQIQRRNRQSYADLSQFAITYGGYFFDNKLKVDLGLRIPDFKRELNNYCYQAASYAYCEPTDPGDTTVFGTSALKSGAYQAATSFKVDYQKYLPNLGVSYKIADHQSIYASYSEMISAPRTDSLYSLTTPNLQPETSQTFDLGYRYSSPLISASASLWKTDFQHRIETGWDEELQLSIATDVGNARMTGANAEIGVRPLKGLNLYASASYTKTEMLNDYEYAAGKYDYTKGMQLGKVPRLMYAFNADYKIGDWQFGLNGKYTGKRYASLANVDYAPAYTLWNADVQYKLGKVGPLNETYLRLNIKNLFDVQYKAQIYSGNAFYDSGNYYYPGQSRTAMLTLDTRF
ncbi:MAG: TonB-dependent receptor [Asticcacaulis sp.]|uniref:TonB-dependent receptor domain-containing protein n=1 Tax=Asticcacaulis sp. TaxID=1872648 RepID=UPI0039E62AE8